MTPMAVRPITLSLCLAVALASSAGAVSDQLQCYKIKDTSIILKGTVDLTTAIEVQTGCKISKAAFYCIASQRTGAAVLNNVTPITVNGYTAEPVTEDRICYKVSCKTPTIPLPLEVDVVDAFGTHALTKLKTGMLCAPVTVGTTFCGDAAKNGAEDCDGTDLGGGTCETLGYSTGTLGCSSGCTYDVSQCVLGKIPATGQTQCWNASGTSIACIGTGEDGHLQAGSALAYQDNGDGTLTDLNTGLMWEKKSDDASVHDRDTLFTWSGAFTQIATLNAMTFAGHNDWRLPNARELLSIVDYGVTGPAVDPAFQTSCFGGCNGIACSCTAFGGHWSSTTVSSLPASAYNVGFFDGSVTFLSKSSTGAVRAVRGGPL
jgi:hypothetical protein